MRTNYMNARDFFNHYKQIVIFDPKFTIWEGSPVRDWSGENEYREIVHVSAQLIDLKSEHVIDSYQCLVRPRINHQLSSYFSCLTGITQEQVDAEGVDFSDMFRTFSVFAGGCDKFAYLKLMGKCVERCVFEENISLYQLPYELPKIEYGVLTPLLQAVGVNTSQYSSGDLYRAFGLTMSSQPCDVMHNVESLVASIFQTRRILLGISL